MHGNKWLLIIVFACMLLMSCGVIDYSNDYIVASVNGDVIYYNEILNALKNVNDQEITFDIILRNSINELLVVQMAPEYHIEYSQEDFDSFVEQYKSTYPYFFSIGSDTYGETQFLEGLYRQRIFNMVREYLQKNVLEPVIVSPEEIRLFCENYSVEYDMLTPNEYDELYERISDEKEDEYFFNWMLEQWENNDIKIYYGIYKNT